MDDEDLLRAIRASAKRGQGAKVRPLDDGARDAIARTIAQSFPPARARRRRRMLFRGGAIAIAIAALVVLVIRPRTPPIEELPAYELVASGGAGYVRSDRSDAVAPVTALHLRNEDRFEIVLRPPREVHGPIAARASLVRRDEAVPFAGKIQVAREGAIRLEGDAADFPGAARGAWTLEITFGRPDALTSEGTSHLDDSAARQVRTIPVILE